MGVSLLPDQIAALGERTLTTRIVCGFRWQRTPQINSSFNHSEMRFFQFHPNKNKLSHLREVRIKITVEMKISFEKVHGNGQLIRRKRLLLLR